MVRTSDVILVIVAIIFPPAAAGMVTGCSCDLVISVCLTILGFVPGLLHAFWLIYKKMQAEEQYGNGGFIYVGSGAYEPLRQNVEGPAHYGATT